jgi:hypothetical protein
VKNILIQGFVIPDEIPPLNGAQPTFIILKLDDENKIVSIETYYDYETAREASFLIYNP